MKKTKKNPRGKRPNPAFGADMIQHMTRSIGPMMLAQAIPDATLTELAVLATLLPTALKLLRSAGKGAADAALDKLYPEGGEIFPGVRLEPNPANETHAAEPGPPEVKQK